MAGLIPTSSIQKMRKGQVMRTSKPYTLFKRSPQKTWYFKLAGEKTRHSTGMSSRAKAEDYVVKILRGEITRERILRFAEFSDKMFVRGKCPFMEMSEKKGKAVSPEMQKMRRGHLINYINKEFGKREINTITPNDIDTWLMKLPIANRTKNHIIDTLRIVMEQAKKEKFVSENPALEITRFAKKQQNRDALTSGEIRTLFPANKEKAIQIWGSLKWASLFYTLITTGIRLGEAQPLQWKDLKQFDNPHGARILVIDKALKNDGRVGTTKNSKSRIVPVLPIVDVLIDALREEEQNAEPSDIIYSTDQGKPIPRWTCLKYFRKILAEQGIRIEDRKLDIHSLRHTTNTIYRRVLDDEVLRKNMGHLTKEMTDNYDHAELEDAYKELAQHTITMENEFMRITA